MSEAHDVTKTSMAEMDRSTRLLVCGILMVLAGGLCLLLVPLIVVAVQFSPEPVHTGSIWISAGFYGALGVLAVLLGIGSVRCRRWARDIILAGATFWLSVGVPAFFFTFWMVAKTMPATMSSAGAEMSSAVVTTIILFTGVFYFLLFIVVPLVLVLLYRGEPVLQTCNRKSGSEGWTTHLTIPQLVCVQICLVIFLNSLFLPVFMPVVMVWDQILTGMPAIALLLVFAGLIGYATWGLYYQVAAAWWVGLISIILMTLNYGIAFYLGDFLEFYRELDFPEEQIRVIEQSGVTSIMKHMWVSMLFYLGIVIAFFWKARPQH